MKLGKKSAVHDPRTLQLAKYLRAAGVAAPPPSEDWASKVKSWPMMANDKIGDCTCAAAGHMIEQWTTYAKDPAVPSTPKIVAAYSAITGYNPKTGANDNGAAEINVLNFWRKTGIAGHKIAGFVAVEPGNHTHVMDAVAIFGNCYIGLALPVSAQQQAVWSVPPGGAVGPGAPGSWGGHAVPVVGYDARGLTVVTWGALKRMTWQFWGAYCDEAYAVLSQDWIDKVNKKAPNQFDFAALQKDLAAL
ncbi:MAG TPA: hypothetical protein VMF53_15080 [Alphaproteobacteria bacterium]|nr:hypothetical protein [Alphaproteobacteria bacterium]